MRYTLLFASLALSPANHPVRKRLPRWADDGRPRARGTGVRTVRFRHARWGTQLMLVADVAVQPP